MLALAASTGKVGFVYLIDGELMDWGLSRKASRDVDKAFATTNGWLTRYRPTFVIVEQLSEETRKGRHTQSIIHAIRSAAEDRGIRVTGCVRRRKHRNKYVEAQALAAAFPQIEPWLPSERKKWEIEPRDIIYFEALSFAHSWLSGDGSGERTGA